MKIQCWPMIKLSKNNDGYCGYSSLGDGNNDKTICIKKGNQVMILNEDDIIELRKTMQFFDISIKS